MNFTDMLSEDPISTSSETVMEDSKKRRKNFTNIEKEVLCNIIQANPEVEDKTTTRNPNDLTKRSAIWVKIAKEFNALEFYCIFCIFIW